MESLQRVLVVGAGLSGMVLATALKRAGLAVELVEIHPTWDVLGVGISVQGPALRALKTIGLLERCIAGGFGYSQVVNCDQNGNIEGVVDLPRLNGPQYPSCVGMMRPVLHDVVAGAVAEAGVAVRFGRTVQAIAQAADSVQITFSDGSAADYELVVGADGANSRVRELIFGADCRPQYTGQAVWRAMKRSSASGIGKPAASSSPSTIASSMAMVAPLASCGGAVCAASPMISTRPLYQGAGTRSDVTGR